MRFIFILVWFGLVSIVSIAQTNPSGTEWMQIRSDNGEFSVEIPTKFKALFDARGFIHSESGDSDGHHLKDMWLISSVVDGTLLSIETYDVDKSALKALRESDVTSKKDAEFREVKKGSYTEGKLIVRTPTYTMKRLYLSSKNRIYILTVGVRDAETAASRRFLDSLKFEPGKVIAANDAKRISELPVEKLLIEQNVPTAPAGSPPVPVSRPADPNTLPYVILSKPRASYTKAARQGNVTANIRLKVTLSNDGFIPKIVVVNSGVDDGLLQQALMAAIRLKFLPKVVDGKLQTVVVTIDYGFSIY